MTDPQAPHPPQRPLLRNEIIADALLDPDEREAIGLPKDDNAPLPVVIELNLQHASALAGAVDQLKEDWDSASISGSPPSPTAEIYCRADLTIQQVRALVAADLEIAERSRRAIYRVWPDFPVQPLIDRSCSTVKADAARRSYDAAGRGIVWAVIDSGIDQNHPHFKRYDTLGGDVASLHRDFTQPGDPELSTALTDGFGHGTHVAGIIAGGIGSNVPDLRVVQQVQDPNERQDPSDGRKTMSRNRAVDAMLLAGIAPHTKLVSLKVLDDAGKGSSMNVVRALEYVRTQVNGQKLMRVHGVNLSVGYEYNAKWFACGQSPLCVEVNRLVRSGVVVVIAAGNTGYGVLSSVQRQTNVGFAMTINDPGNADLPITVGSTHRDMPHTYGVSYFSSKGPTGDGRAKPDLVAPGERITSCAAGVALANVGEVSGRAVYVEDSGTSMAAPHVSGAIAAFLSIRQEFIGQPEQVKQIFTSSATSLGRERYFEGHGLVDLMRAIQSI
jgi:subtilisin family serine protease